MKAQDGKEAEVVGFMAPLDQWDEVERFVLLPLPIECLACESPPQRDMVLVELTEPTRLVNELAIVSGKLVLDAKPGVPFWYRITSAAWRAAFEGEELTEREVPEEHRHAPAKIMEALGKIGHSRHLPGAFGRAQDQFGGS